MTLFDAYLIVDWNASNSPTTGKDSIWYCMISRVRNNRRVLGPENVATRHEAFQQILGLLAENVSQGLSTLVGFDFPYGYPSGFAAALGITHKKTAAWKQVWNFLSARVQDDKDNRNNRFEVAAELNKRISGANYPFWGCPSKKRCSTLSPTKPRGQFNLTLAEKRITENRTKNAQAVWKLFGAGAVGSQALMGIPHVAKLRNHARLKEVSRVWPFETGLRKLPERKQRDWLILHAEIYPAIIKLTQRSGEVADAAQVRCLAEHFADLDDPGELAIFFGGPDDLGEERRRIVQAIVQAEEGWILGVK